MAVCPDAPVTVAQVQEGLDLWSVHGAPVLQARSSECNGGTERHVVYVDRPRSEDYAADAWTTATIALTTVYRWEDEPHLISGRIALEKGSREPLLHELGHLWFSEHHPADGHVMSEWIESYAEDFRGVPRAFMAQREAQAGAR